jgi:hypothetical protein
VWFLVWGAVSARDPPPGSIPSAVVPPAGERAAVQGSRWSARSEARTYDLELWAVVCSASPGTSAEGMRPRLPPQPLRAWSPAPPWLPIPEPEAPAGGMFERLQLVKALEKAGFELARVRGSHHVMRHADGRTVAVPVHSGYR